MRNKFLRLIPFIVFPLYFLFVAPSPAHAGYLASDLLGQLDANDNPVYTTSSANNGSSTVNNRGFNAANSLVLDVVHHRLFVNDQNNNRVLIFNLDSNNNLLDRVADNVLGQSTFTTSTAATSQSGLNAPHEGLLYDSVHDRLFVAEFNNNRVMVFDTSVITDGMNASYVLGQPDFTTSTAATTQSGMFRPTGLGYDPNNNYLFVKDRFNRRVLVFDLSAGITNGMNASYVLGQTTFNTSSSATTQSGLSNPNGNMPYDSENKRLFVSDNANHRVLIFDLSSGITNGMNASYVLGQTSFTSSTAEVTQSGMQVPQDVAYDPLGKQLFVTDDNSSNRVLVFDVSTITNGESAVAVIGQDNFTSSTVGTTQSLARPYALAYDATNRRMYLSSHLTGNRVAIFNFIRLATSSPATATVTAGTSYSISHSSTQSQGTVSYATTSGSLPPGLTLTTSTGVITGTPTTVGTYNFTIQAIDDNGAIGYFVSQPQSYTITVGPAATVTVGNNNYASAQQPSIYLPSASITLETPSIQTPTQVSVPSTQTFTQNLKVADKKSDVQSLQQYLNANGFILTQTGPGSPGNETSKFGAFTYAALIKFQEAHADEILKPVGLTKGTGYFGPLTRAYVNSH